MKRKEQRMKHSVTFNQAENHWDNALPLGNGVLGAMLYFESGTLQMPLNHYEVYYNINDSVLPSSHEAADRRILESADAIGTPGCTYGRHHTNMRAKADGNAPIGDEPFCEYRITREMARDESRYSIAPFSGSYPMTGDLSFEFSPALDGAAHRLTLSVEDAAVFFSLEKKGKRLEAATRVLREDCVLTEFSATDGELLRAIGVSFAPYRDLDAPDVRFVMQDSHTLVYSVTRPLSPSGKPFVFSGIIRVMGAKAKLSADCYTAALSLEECEEKITVLTGIFTDWRYTDPTKDGLCRLLEWEDQLDRLKAAHASYWREFFDRASITLPDKFLENVYYVNLYALDCCSGKGGVMKHHACGLNGLWDIKHPSLWGSMWYWDVNIQASFAGVFTNNRLDLARVFSEGLLSYVTRAKSFAVSEHALRGIAADYPYSFYYSVWPWCAQYLWFLYEYSQDRDYLKNEAYPVFLSLCEFCLGLFIWDEALGYYRVYPDISPEQGPLAHDTTATVSAVKYLLRFTLEAAELLGDQSDMLAEIKNLLAHLPPYAIAEPGMWGTPIKDSPDAPDNLWLRHPMVLMPIYPTGEIDPLVSDENWTKIAGDTVDFAFDRTELGIFQGSWLSAAAARLGRGNDAIRALYERGLDHMLRSNGLTAEATDRFMNFCLIGRQPLYYPCMMEFTGEMLAAVGEMLLGSHNGIIRVFPAIPNKKPTYTDFHRFGYPVEEEKARQKIYDAWRDVCFDKLLAKGAFEVSAALKDGKLSYIKINSKKGGILRITSPFLTKAHRVRVDGIPCEAKWDGDILCIATKAQDEVLITLDSVAAPSTQERVPAVLMHTTATKRKIFIGEDSDTAYYRALDSATREWFYGNLRHANHTLYKFDFGAQNGKEYWREFPAQSVSDSGRSMKYTPFIPIFRENARFTPKQGYGFADLSGIHPIDRGAPDLLRQDFLEGEADAEFLVETPRGQYELLVVSGDAKECSVTKLSTEQGFVAGGGLIAAGRYQCELIPVIQKKDGLLRLFISTCPGCKWKLNLLILNTLKGY